MGFIHSHVLGGLYESAWIRLNLILCDEVLNERIDTRTHQKKSSFGAKLKLKVSCGTFNQ